MKNKKYTYYKVLQQRSQSSSWDDVAVGQEEIQTAIKESINYHPSEHTTYRIVTRRILNASR